MTEIRNEAEEAPIPESVSFGEALRVWARIGLLSFGGPAGQIAVMHDELVKKRRWIDEGRFLHALSYCTVLPGPEAQQLATYLGWLMHRTPGGLAAGTLFVLPGALVALALSITYATLRDVAWGAGLFHGLEAVVLAIVLVALVRVGKRALRTRAHGVVAAASFVGLFFFDVPFPFVVAGLPSPAGSADAGRPRPSPAEPRVAGAGRHPRRARHAVGDLRAVLPVDLPGRALRGGAAEERRARGRAPARASARARSSTSRCGSRCTCSSARSSLARSGPCVCSCPTSARSTWWPQPSRSRARARSASSSRSSVCPARSPSAQGSASSRVSRASDAAPSRARQGLGTVPVLEPRGRRLGRPRVILAKIGLVAKVVASAIGTIMAKSVGESTCMSRPTLSRDGVGSRVKRR
ncbi:MAG: hypothetical protein OHK0013_25970 [Sandaracinaceae bacterium]